MKATRERLVIGVDATPFCRKIDGVGRYNVNIVSTLARRHPEAKIILIGFLGDKIHSEVSALLPDSVTLHRLPLPRRIYQALFARLFAINLGRLAPRCDVLLCLNFTLFPYIKQPGLRRFVLIHDTAFADVPEVVEPRNRTYLSRRVPWSMQRADAVLTISGFTSERVQELFGIPSKKLCCVGSGVQESFFAKNVEPHAIKDMPNSYVLCVSTLEPRKNIANLVRAHALLPMKLREQYPLILGGRLRNDSQLLAQLIEETPHVRSIGYVNDADLPGLYKRASLFVLPPLYEGFGIPLIEAMASKVPVIASDIPLFRSIAADTVTYADARSSKTLSRAIENALVSKKRHSTTERAYLKARDYSWGNVAERTWDAMNTGVQRV